MDYNESVLSEAIAYASGGTEVLPADLELAKSIHEYLKKHGWSLTRIRHDGEYPSMEHAIGRALHG